LKSLILYRSGTIVPLLSSSLISLPKQQEYTLGSRGELLFSVPASYPLEYTFTTTFEGEVRAFLGYVSEYFHNSFLRQLHNPLNSA
jgi:hypothetical protein